MENDRSNNVIVRNGLCMEEGGGRVNREADIDSIFYLELGRLLVNVPAGALMLRKGLLKEDVPAEGSNRAIE